MSGDLVSQAQEAAADLDACDQAEFARRHGWGKSYITKLKQEGRLVFTAGGLVDVAASLARIQETTGAPGRASEPAVAPTVRSEKDRQAFYDAEKSRLDLEERTKQLLVALEVLAGLADAAVGIRTELEAWPEQLAPELASLGADEGRLRACLAGHVEVRLGELARRFAAIAGTAQA